MHFINRIIFAVGLGTILIGQDIRFIPFDWSHQLGSYSQHGISQWNREWTSGPVLFSNEISSYPLKYGSRYEQDLALYSPNGIHNIESLEDTTLTLSKIDYAQGDFDINIFEMNGLFINHGRQMNIHGFKRSHTGAYGQFIHPDAVPKPIQQSYRFDYSSSIESWDIALSTGKYLTGHGVFDTSGVHSLTKDDMTLVGLQMTKTMNSNEISFGGSMSSRVFSLASLNVPITGTFYSSRNRIYSRFSTTDWLSISVSHDQRSLTKKNSNIIAQKWSTLWVEHKLAGITWGGGLSLGNSMESLGFIKSSIGKTHFSLDIDLSSMVRPLPLLLQQSFPDNAFQRFNSGLVQLQYGQKGFQLKGFTSILSIGDYMDGSILLDSTYNVSSTESAITTGGNIYIRKWDFSLGVGYIHHWESGTLTHGFSDQISISLNGGLPLFDGNLKARFSLDVEGYLNNDPLWNMDPYTGIPFVSSAFGTDVSDYWVGHFSIEAKVSTFTMIWSVKNIADALEPALTPTSVQIPAISNNRLLPDMNQLITFKVIWEFRD